MSNSVHPQPNRPEDRTKGRGDDPMKSRDSSRGPEREPRLSGVRGGASTAHGTEEHGRASEDVLACLDAIEENCRALRHVFSADPDGASGRRSASADRTSTPQDTSQHPR